LTSERLGRNVSPFMKAALTTQTLTRDFAGVVIVRRDHRMSWQVTKNYPSTGTQEEQG
jgi:hypothetical protein